MASLLARRCALSCRAGAPRPLPCRPSKYVNSRVASVSGRMARQAPALVCASSASDAAPDADAPTTSSAAGQFSEEEQRLLWDSVSRALLRLGRAGATDAHARSLSELLRSHKLVKVQVNAPPDAAAAAAAALAAACGAVLLQAKGTTLLFGDGGAAGEALLEAARESAGKTQAWRERRSGEREKRQEKLRATEAKREANASRSRRKIGAMIQSVSGKGGGGGGVTKEALRGEWQQLAAGIAAEEAGEAAAAAPPPKQPWKRGGGGGSGGAAAPDAGKPQ
ncbi:MAG: hypothetical protein J3K34DRAFT_461308 [Monoraphidium minutum]|nr:MAG: hypothetical protein J3K34DRAFT_461308 [Monoraphidium minutum]